jgi:hypothetical protein
MSKMYDVGQLEEIVIRSETLLNTSTVISSVAKQFS